MDKLKKPILFTTLVWLLTQLSPLLGNASVVLAAIGITWLLIIWMVVRILKDGKPANKTFDEQFYDIDSPIDVRC